MLAADSIWLYMEQQCYTLINCSDIVGFLDELHVLNDSALTVVLQFVLNTLLLHETLPI